MFPSSCFRKPTGPLTRARGSLLGWLMLTAIGTLPLPAQHQVSQPGYHPKVAPASDEGELAIRKFLVAPGLKVDLFAAEPHLANPVGFGFDERGRAYVCETFRHFAGVIDIRGIMPWLDEDLACRTVEDRLLMMRRHLGEKIVDFTRESERVKLLEDRDGDGRVDHSTVFAEGFNTILDGIGASVLVRKGRVYYSNVPNLWALRDADGDGVSDERTSLHYGYGVRIGFLGHDLHGLRFGPDGKIYYSIGDRGAAIRTPGGMVGEADTGCVFRCNPDGSDLEVFAFGLRNPQGLAFDDHGNLFTGDNNSDSGDRARWVYLVEGGDSGWRVGYQYLEGAYSRGPFNAERLWYPQFEGQAAYIVPPITNITDGPSGLSYYPGTGLPSAYRGHFFLADFRGGANSGVHAFTVRPRGATFELADARRFIWQVLATDCQFGVDGGLYVSDWVQGWDKTGKGRIYRVHDPAVDASEAVRETKRLLAEGLSGRSLKELTRLLGHEDQRVRQEAQFTLAERGSGAIKAFAPVANRHANLLARLHAIWGLGQVSRHTRVGADPQVVQVLLPLLEDGQAEVRAQAARVLGDLRAATAYDALVGRLGDASPRVRFFAAIALGRLGRPEAVPALFALLRENADRDPYLRHAAVMGLTGGKSVDALVRASKETSRSVRLGAVLALRRLERSEIAVFLEDPDPLVVLEAARAINDLPIAGATAALAALAGRPTDSEPLLRRVLNANLRHGTAEAAQTLAGYAAREGGVESMRVEALDALADWPTVSGRDRVTGLWRPTAFRREAGTPREALKPLVGGLLLEGPERVRVAAARAAGALEVLEAGPALFEVVGKVGEPVAVRVAALRALDRLNDGRLADAVRVAAADSEEALRQEATRLQARLGPAGAVEALQARLESGTLGEKQAALAALAGLTDPAVDPVISRWLDRLLAGEVPRELQLDVLEAGRKRENAAIKERLAAYEARKSKDDPLAAFVETLYGGNAMEGRKVFYERPEAACVRCHKVGGEGGEVGPDLSHLGAQRDRLYVLRGIVAPNAEIAAGFESITVSLKDGTILAGVLKSETAEQIVINSPEDGLVTVQKSQLQSRDKGLSPMPEGLGDVLSKTDIRNLVEYLSGLK